MVHWHKETYLIQYLELTSQLNSSIFNILISTTQFIHLQDLEILASAFMDKEAQDTFMSEMSSTGSRTSFYLDPARFVDFNATRYSSGLPRIDISKLLLLNIISEAGLDQHVPERSSFMALLEDGLDLVARTRRLESIASIGLAECSIENLTSQQTSNCGFQMSDLSSAHDYDSDFHRVRLALAIMGFHISMRHEDKDGILEGVRFRRESVRAQCLHLQAAMDRHQSRFRTCLAINNRATLALLIPKVLPAILSLSGTFSSNIQALIAQAQTLTGPWAKVKPHLAEFELMLKEARQIAEAEHQARMTKMDVAMRDFMLNFMTLQQSMKVLRAFIEDPSLEDPRFEPELQLCIDEVKQTKKCMAVVSTKWAELCAVDEEMARISNGPSARDRARADM